MKQALVNGRWNIWLPDNIADWDAISGDPVARRGWEYCRFESMQKNLHYGDIFFDVGAEHGWISAIIAREFVGAENMVLFEPSPEFWVNIRRIWKWNNLDDPMGFWPGFVSNGSSGGKVHGLNEWPTTADATQPEVPGMAYRSLVDPSTIPSIRIDDFVEATGIWPTAINIDIEGAELMALQGAGRMLTHPNTRLTNVWVSIHPDLLERDFGSTKQDVLDFMADCGWSGVHLGTDHEEHWWWHRD